MSHQITTSGKTVEDAINAALAELGVHRSEVDIEIVEEGTKGIFGLGSKDAVVNVTVKAADPILELSDFLSELVYKIEPSCSVKITEEEDAVKAVVTGDGVGTIIGRRGETLDAVQYLASLVVNKGKHGDEYKRVIVDTENYRAKRQETLIRLANSIASKVVKYRKELALEPMTPYERRIIHSALQNHKYVSTKSVGNEPNRKVVVFIK